VTYGQQFFVTTPDAANISTVAWIRLSATTHSFNQNQRINRLGFTSAGGSLTVTAPSTAVLCPPGHYLLFILKGGVPSIAQIMQIQ
jgi:galactose oxidase